MADRKAYYVEYMRKYRSEHPEAILRHRLQQAVNLLSKHGYLVIAPEDGKVKQNHE